MPDLVPSSSSVSSSNVVVAVPPGTLNPSPTLRRRAMAKEIPSAPSDTLLALTSATVEEFTAPAAASSPIKVGSRSGVVSAQIGPQSPTSPITMMSGPPVSPIQLSENADAGSGGALRSLAVASVGLSTNLFGDDGGDGGNGALLSAPVDDRTFASWWRRAEEQRHEATNVRLGVLALALDKLLLAPTTLEKPLCKALSVEGLLAMVDHPQAATRLCVVQLINWALRTREPLFRSAFVRADGFDVLAAQLSRHAVTPELVVTCCDLLTGQDTGVQSDADTSRFDLLSESTNASVLADMAVGAADITEHLGYPVRPRGEYPGESAAAIVLTSMLRTSVMEDGDVTLGCRILGTLHRIFQRRSDLRQAFMDDGELIVTLCNILSEVTAGTTSTSSTATVESEAAGEDRDIDGVVVVGSIGTDGGASNAAEASGDAGVASIKKSDTASSAKNTNVTTSTSTPSTTATATSTGGDGISTSPCPSIYFATATSPADLARAIEAFCQDVTALHICGYIMHGRDNARGLALLRDTLDTIEVVSAVPVPHRLQLQRCVLTNALDRVLVDVHGAPADDSALLRHTMIAAATVCQLAVDHVVFHDACEEARGGEFAFICHVFHVVKGLLARCRAPDAVESIVGSQRQRVVETLGRLCLHLLSPTQPISRGGFLMQNLASALDLVSVLCEHVSPDYYNFYTGARIFLAVYSFFTIIERLLRECEVGSLFADLGGERGTARPADMLGVDQLRDVANAAELIMTHIATAHKRLVHTIIDVEGSSFGDVNAT
eukprot:UC1_evm1s1695